MTTDLLANIKASAGGLSVPQLMTMRCELAAHVRYLEEVIALGPGAITAIVQRMGGDGPGMIVLAAKDANRDVEADVAAEHAARLEAFRSGLDHLDSLLGDADPVMAAQAKGYDERARVERNDRRAAVGLAPL